jgi:hypothetical protein
MKITIWKGKEFIEREHELCAVSVGELEKQLLSQCEEIDVNPSYATIACDTEIIKTECDIWDITKTAIKIIDYYHKNESKMFNRWDYVDNTIHDMIVKLNPSDTKIEWNGTVNNAVRSVLIDYFVNKLKICTEYEFYP